MTTENTGIVRKFARGSLRCVKAFFGGIGIGVATFLLIGVWNIFANFVNVTLFNSYFLPQFPLDLFSTVAFIVAIFAMVWIFVMSNPKNWK